MPFQGPSLNGASVASTSQVRPSSVLATLTDRRKLQNKEFEVASSDIKSVPNFIKIRVARLQTKFSDERTQLSVFLYA
jgi:hypothetical protein